MRLVKDARQSWRWLTVQFATVLMVIPQAWDMMPDDIKAWVPEEWRPHAVTIMGAAILIGRLIDQGSRDD